MKLKKRIAYGAGDNDIAIIEIGGTVGDIESQPFLEAIRQMKLELGSERTLFTHLTFVPYLASSGETKNKTNSTFREKSVISWSASRYF